MSIATIEIKYVETSLEMLNEFGNELNLDAVLTEELASDINNAF